MGRRARHHDPRRARPRPTVGSGLVLSTWKQLLDNGTMLVGDKHLAATARPAVARVSQAVHDACGPTVTVTGDRGSITLPSEVAPDIVDGVVWLPASSTGLGLLTDLASPGSRVTVTGGNHDDLDQRRCVVDEGLQAFGQDKWWVVGIKVLLIFLILVLLTLFNIWWERRVVARMQHRIGPNRQRALRPAAVAGRRRQADVQGGHPPQGRRQGRLRPRPDHRGDPGLRDVLRSSRSGPRSTSSASAPRSSSPTCRSPCSS